MSAKVTERLIGIVLVELAEVLSGESKPNKEEFFATIKAARILGT